MAENGFENTPPQDDPKIIVNEYGSTMDSAVVIEEADRTVLLTDNETIVFPKEAAIDVVPKNRPRKVYGGMWGQTEIATVGLGVLAILSTLLLYLLVVVPSNNELERNRAERDQLERDLLTARTKYGNITTTEGQVARLLASVDSFESNYLPSADSGRTNLYQRINGLISGYGLVNTSGPDYAPLDVADATQNGQTDDQRGRGKFRSLFPGVYVTMTVEGSYQNLRRFLREIETGNEFMVVSTVEIEPTDTQKKADAPQQPAAARASTGAPAGGGVPGFPGTTVVPNPAPPRGPSAPRGTTHGETVSLRLEMAAYFRRPNAGMIQATPQ